MSLISYVTRIHFADQVLEYALDAELLELAMLRPLVLWDGGEGREDLLQCLAAAMPDRVEAQVFRLPEAGATEEAAEGAALHYQGHDCDGLIAFGGGEALHLAKVVALRVSHAGALRDYLDCEGGRARIRNVLPPTIAIPATAGTGAEASDTAVFALAEGGCGALSSPYLLPRVVICDPTLTLDMDGRATACAGMEALAHCIETFIAAAFNPPADAIAADGLRHAFLHLERAVVRGGDLDARREMRAAALNGSLAQQKGLGAIRAMSNALFSCGDQRASGRGALCAVLLPWVLEFNAPAAGGRYPEIRRQFSLAPGADLGEALIRLRDRVGLPARLSDLGITEEVLVKAACFAAKDLANRTNPRKAGPEDYLALMRRAL